MLDKRKAAWNRESQPDLENIEAVLEFLEKVSRVERKGVISLDLIWDTFGWYVTRYYCYSRAVIKGQLRKKWTPKRDDRTLYQDLQRLVGDLLERDVRNRNRLKKKKEPSL